jgi:hypothetical protein
VGGLLFLSIWLLKEEDEPPQLLRVSEAGRVSLKKGFYACEDRYPDFQVLSVETESLAGYKDRDSFLSGYEFWREDETLPPEERDYAVYLVMRDKKYVCQGRFEHYSATRWVTCEDGFDEYLVFAADDCHPEDMTVEDVFDRDLESIRQEAEQGLAESQYRMGIIHSREDLMLLDRELARHWYGLAAEQGH